MRPFNSFEQNNLRFLVNHNVKFTQVEITPTGLEKSILDATAPMRAYFMENNVHSYEDQQQGPESKEIKEATILTSTDQCSTKVSFYRPVTKKGDPRLWIYKLNKFTEGNDIHVLFWHDCRLFSINITQIDIERCYNSPLLTPLKEVINDIYKIESAVSDELLGLFLKVKDKWFESEVTADTGIGRTIESFLGIKMNSNKTPDYKGIELKSHREKRKSTKNVLFTQAPNWDISVLKSGREIVQHYGYLTEEGRKTYQNTVQCAPPNSQHLFLSVCQLEHLLRLQSDCGKVEDVAAWKLMKLHESLLTKHHETFWIEVENVLNDGKEYFRYKQIEHTKNPNVGQFDALIEQNFISVDLLLCRPSGRGDTYSFKIKKKGMPLLFPKSVIYQI